MRHLTVRSSTYLAYLSGFAAWLSVMGYSAATAYSLPGMLQEFLHYLESHGLTDIRDATPDWQQDYIGYLSTRKHQRGEGALSAVHINGHIGMLERFSEYLQGMQGLPWPIGVQRLPEAAKTDWVVLDLEEIHRLYHSTDDTIYGIRDRALLAVYYGCGCRKSEGAALNVNDVLTDRRLLCIRKSKNGKGRQVPMTTTVLGHLQQYLEAARPLFTPEGQNSEALFISQRGRRLSAEMIYQRIKALQRQAGLDKEIGLHTLRHSIATHLLQKGMPLENIALFLGHESLDSTQIYTHIQPII